MKQYLDALQHIVANGTDRGDRTNTGTRGVFGYQMRFNLALAFPAVTTKKLAWRSVVSELLWFLEGSTDERRLAEIHYGKPREELVGKTTIWTANADAQGKALGYVNTDTIKELGPVYGKQWRDFNGAMYNSAPMYQGTDQIANVINQIKNDPNSRRIILSAWNPVQIDKMALPPCHALCQFYVSEGKLSCQLYQRSADMFLGVPFNIASYALLTHMLAQICELGVGDFIWSGGDCHIYSNHTLQVAEQLTRTPQRKSAFLQMPAFSNIAEIQECTPDQFELVGYNPMESIKAPMAI